MTCARATDIACYVLGSLDPNERGALEDHLAGCETCRAELASFAGLPGLLSRVSAREAEAGLPVARPQLLENILAAAAAHRRTRRHRYLGAAAALIFIVGGSGIGFAIAAPEHHGTTVTAANGPVQVHIRLVGAAEGSRIALTLRGVPAGEKCRLVAVGKDGTTHDAGSWYASYSGDATVDETAALAPANIAAFRVETLTGQLLVSVPLNG